MESISRTNVLTVLHVLWTKVESLTVKQSQVAVSMSFSMLKLPAWAARIVTMTIDIF
jgi:hypothetical protein